MVNSGISDKRGGGLNRLGAYLKYWLRGEGLIREGGLIERGLNRAASSISSNFARQMVNCTDENYTGDQQKSALRTLNYSFASVLKTKQSKHKVLMNSVFRLILLPYPHTNLDVK